jgi:hypothetical protein
MQHFPKELNLSPKKDIALQFCELFPRKQLVAMEGELAKQKISIPTSLYVYIIE